MCYLCSVAISWPQDVVQYVLSLHDPLGGSLCVALLGALQSEFFLSGMSGRTVTSAARAFDCELTRTAVLQAAVHTLRQAPPPRNFKNLLLTTGTRSCSFICLFVTNFSVCARVLSLLLVLGTPKPLLASEVRAVQLVLDR